MSEKLKESLSAVIDGEADEFELRRVLDEVGRDEQLAASWERYHLVGSVLRGERTVTVTGMRERIWAELQTDRDSEGTVTPVAAVMPAAPAAASGSVGRNWKPVAIAASVAAAVLVGFVGFSELDSASAPAAVAETESGVNAQQESLYQTVALSSEVTDSDQVRTDAYIVRHYQQIGMDQPGVGFVRMVAYERD